MMAMVAVYAQMFEVSSVFSHAHLTMEAAGQIPMWLCRHQLNGDHVILRRCVWAGGGGGVGGGGGGVGYVQHAADHSRRGLLAAHTCVSLQKAVFFVFFVGCVFIVRPSLAVCIFLACDATCKSISDLLQCFQVRTIS